MAAQPRPAVKTVDPRDLPALPAVPGAPPVSRAAAPDADFTPLEKRDGGHFDPRRSKVVSRSMFVDEYANPDGTRTLRQSGTPLNVRDAAGQWQPVDTVLRGSSVDKRTRAPRHPLNPSVAERADDPAVLSVEADGKKATLAFEGAAPVKAAVSGEKAVFPDIAPDTDLDYEITRGAVKETILLKRPPAASSWRFRLSATGLTPVLDRADGTGSVLLKDSSGAVVVSVPPVDTWDSAGGGDKAPGVTGGRYGLERAGDQWVLTVSVDGAWLRDAKRVYPVHVDPTFSFGVVESHSYRSDGYVCDSCGLRIGNSQNSGDSYNRAVFKADYSPLFGKNVVNARLDVTRNTSVVGSVKTWPAALYHAAAFDFNGVGSHMADALVGDVGSFSAPEFTAFVKYLVDNRNATAFFMLIGSENPGTWTYKNLDATLTVDTGSAPPAAAMSAPADGSVLTSLTPTLTVGAVSDPDGDPVKYCFKVATGPDAKSGVVVDSGCLSTPSWPVPAGVLQDGVAYTWQATTFSGATGTAPPWIGHFRVDQRIGDHGPSPVDTLGPFTVNLANGNVSTTTRPTVSPLWTSLGSRRPPGSPPRSPTTPPTAC
jgi:hypothetical protein